MSLPVFAAYRRINTILGCAARRGGAGGCRNTELHCSATHPDTSRSGKLLYSGSI